MYLVNDKDAIQEVLHRYAFHMNNFEFEKALELFTEDAIFDETSVIPDAYFDSRQKLRDFYAANVPNMGDMMHMYFNFILTNLREEEASTTTTLLLESSFANGEPNRLKGYWEDKFRKVDGEWKFSYRKLTLLPKNPYLARG
jgi:ketosteroid isomerase-like protein